MIALIQYSKLFKLLRQGFVIFSLVNEMANERLLSSLINTLQHICNVNIYVLNGRISLIRNEYFDEERKAEYIEIWRICLALSASLLESRNFLTQIPGWNNGAAAVNMFYYELSNRLEENIFSALELASSLKSSLESLSNTVKYFCKVLYLSLFYFVLDNFTVIQFKTRGDTSTLISNELQRFTNMGNAIKNSASGNRIVREIDQLIGKISRYIGTENVDEDGDSYPRTFIALAAPSMVGKTQLSFSLSAHRSIYFALNQYTVGDAPAKQLIYLNYANLNRCIYDCGKRDTDHLISKLSIRDPSSTADNLNSAYKFISAEYLTVNLRTEKFFTLGLFLKLIEDSEANFIEDGTISWMEFHANRPNMMIQAVSIEELAMKSEYFSKYFVFLDEFSESFINVFVRNICRSSAIVCVVANTNTVIANLVGQNQTGHSGTTSNAVWSIVVGEFDHCNCEILQSTSNILQSVRTICSKLHSHDAPILRRFIVDILNNQIHYIRPGIAGFFVVALEKLSNETDLSDFNIVDCLDFILNYIYKRIIDRKSYINSQIDGIIANFALHSSLAYRNMYPDLSLRNSSYFSMKSFLQNHLFYVINPVDRNNWFFKLYISTHSSQPLCINRNGVTAEWAELSYFKAEEHLTALACMFGTIAVPVATLMRSSSIRDLIAVSTSNMPNPKQKSSDGLNFETLCSISSIDSSHFVSDDSNHQASLAGVRFPDYLVNMIRNLIEKAPFGPFNNNKLSVFLSIPKKLKCFNSSKEHFDLLKYLEFYRVPFLGASDVQWPHIYSQLFPLSSPSCSVKLGTFSRAINSDQLDGYFDIIHETQNNGPGMRKRSGYSICETVIECKDLSGDLQADFTFKILKKVFRRKISNLSKDIKFAFIFCNTIGGDKFETIKETDTKILELRNYLVLNRINIFRFCTYDSTSIHQAKFQCIPYRGDAPIFKNPALTVFIFAFHDINLIDIDRIWPKLNY